MNGMTPKIGPVACGRASEETRDLRTAARRWYTFRQRRGRAGSRNSVLYAPGADPLRKAALTPPDSDNSA